MRSKYDVFIFTTSDMNSEALLVDLGDTNLKPKVKGRSSFYSLPKTLSEDDDPFGVFQSSRQSRKSGQEEASTACPDTNIGLLVQIEPESPRVSVSEFTRFGRIVGLLIVCMFNLIL